MPKLNRATRLSPILFLLLIAAVTAQETTLNVGDAAPALFASKWINGDAVQKFEAGKVYVVEFWATWCGPCKMSIPHLSKMNTELKDKGVTFIGVDCREQDNSKTEAFVKQMGDKMNYRVALDVDVPGADQGKTADAWLGAAGQDGIPCAFVVDKAGKLAWIGHPMDGLDRVLKGVLDGSFDTKKEAERAAKDREFQKKIMAAAKAGDVKALQALADDLLASDPEKGTKFSAKIFGYMLAEKHDYEGAYAYANRITDALSKDSEALNEISWTIMDAQGVEKRDLDLALKLAQKADGLTQHNDPQVLDTLARAYFEKKDVARAIEIETLAVGKADGEIKQQLTETLKNYQAAKK